MHITINNESREPIYSQIVSQVRLGVASGELEAGHKLPSVRELARTLSLNPNTVAKAYTDLERAGVVRSRRGHGTFISDSLRSLTREEVERFVRDRAESLVAEARRLGLTRQHLLAELIRAFSTIPE
ncbi:GntR family transcriptional regulator [Candidatus Hydrogenedentota bacterium]